MLDRIWKWPEFLIISMVIYSGDSNGNRAELVLEDILIANVDVSYLSNKYEVLVKISQIFILLLGLDISLTNIALQG